MEITSTNQKGKNVVGDVSINYNIRKDGADDIQEIHGIIMMDDKSIGFASYDYVRSGFQFSLNPDNGLDATEKKALYDAFVDDVEQLITV